MSVQVRRRREAASFLSTYVGAQGEILVDTTNNRVQVHDGSTPGGWPAAKTADLGSMAPQNANAVSITGGTINGVTSVIAGAGGFQTTRQAGMQFGAPGYFMYSDTANYYFFLTGTQSLTSVFTAQRPLIINLSSGYVTMAQGVNITNGATIDTLVVSSAATFSAPPKLPSFTVATLPAAGSSGRLALCSNARMFNGTGAQEAAGSGTGGLVSDNGSAWKIAGTNITASA